LKNDMKNYSFLLFFAFVFIIFLWQGIFLPKDENSLATESFLIEKGQSFFEISQNLEKESLIKSQFYFDFYLFLTVDYKKLQSGQYLLSSSMTIPEIAGKFVSGEIQQLKTTIPEGFTCQQIEIELQSSGLCQLLAPEFKSEFDFLKDAPPEASLEGFLFPDTYYFSLDETNGEIVRKFLMNFDKKLTPDLKTEINSQGKTIFEIVTMASMLENEVKTLEDKKLVSGILWKRLKNNIPLQVDATISYITDKKSATISIDDTKIDSPYNTYKYKGLPFGPISNPGLESILAAIYPEKSDYWYYLSIPEGKTIFSKTLEEHNLAKAKYLK